MTDLAEQQVPHPFDSDLDLRGSRVALPPDPNILVEPNYSIFRQGIDQRFDGTLERHDQIVAYNSLTQSVDKIFNNNVKYVLGLPDRETQVQRLMEYGDKPLAPRHIVQIAQELTLRSATTEVIDFLDAQERVAERNGTEAFFESPEVMQWRATELQKAGRHNEAVGLSDQILETKPENNPEALRTKAMAEVAKAGGGDRAAALKSFEEGFAKTGDYSLGMGALNAALEMNDMVSARQIAPLVALAAENIGADQSKSFWPAVVNAQAAIVDGDATKTERAMQHLSEVLNAKTENGTPVASETDKAAALKRIDAIVAAQGGSGGEVESLLRPLTEQLKNPSLPVESKGAPDLDDTFRKRGYTSRQGMTPDGFHVRGNVRVGGMLPDSSTTLRDKMQFLEVAQTPLDKFIKGGLIQKTDLPAGVDPQKSLYDIADPETRIKASQVVARGIFDVDGRNLEDLHGIDHKIYDSVVRLRIAHAGATAVGNVSDEDYAAYQKIKGDGALLNAVGKGEVTPEQRQFLSELSPALGFRIDPVGSAQRLVKQAEAFRGSDTRTNLAVAAAEGIGDCRHVAAATEALVSAVQQDKTAGLIREAAASLQQGDTDSYNRFSQAANAEINGYEMRVYDQEVRAAVEVLKTYDPILTKDGKFVASVNDTPQLIETHMHNVVRMAGTDGAAKYVVADSFYQKGPYRMGWVENATPETFEKDGMARLRLSGGEVEAVVCERDAKGKLILDQDGHPVPLLDEKGQPQTVRRPLVLESTKYSSPDRLEIGAPGPEDRLNGASREPGGPRLAERLQNTERRADYVSQAEFIVNNPSKADTPELSKPGEMEQAKARVGEQAERLMLESAPKDVLERYAAGNAVVATYQTSGVSAEGSKTVPSAGQADSYAVVTSKEPIDEAAMSRIMDGLSDRGNAVAGSSIDKDSTGALVSVTQREAGLGAASFDIVAGARGDSRTFIANVDANNNVSLFDVNANTKRPDDVLGSMGFGADGARGANELLTQRVDIKKGERVFVFNVSDGVIDPYVAASAGAGRPAGAYVDDIRSDIEAHLKANPETQDFSRFLAERATTLGAQDNTTVTSLRLGADTDLQGKSVTMAVFDGTGHEDGALSSALAKHLPEAVPGAEPQKPVARKEIAHVAARKEDLARAREPAAVHPRDNHIAPKPEEHPVPHTHASVPEKAPAPHEHRIAKTPVEPVHEAHASGAHPEGLHARIGGHAANGVGVAGVALALAEGKYQEAGVSAAQQVALNPGTYKAAAQLAEDIAPVAKGLGFIGKKIPLIGAVVTAGYVAYEVGSDVAHHEYGKAGAALGAGAAEALGNVVGFGVGDAAREGVREAVVLTAGEKYAPNKSGLRQLGEGAYHLAHKAFDQTQHPGTQTASVAPSIYHYKNLPAVAFVLKDTPDRDLNGKTIRTPDGFIKNLRELDMADPKNLRAFEEAIHRRIQKNEQIIEAGKPLLEIQAVSSFLGLRGSSRKVDDAKVETRQLQGALRELEMFKHDVHEHHGQASAPKVATESRFHAGHTEKVSPTKAAAPEKKAPPKPVHPKLPTP